jgi:hypothetical protein
MKTVRCIVVFLLVGFAFANAAGQQWEDAIQKELESRYLLTTIDSRGEIQTRGTEVILKKNNLAVVGLSTPNFGPGNTYKNGTITQPFLGKLNRVPGMATSKTLTAGEKLLVTGIEVKDDGVVFQLLTDVPNGVRYKTSLRFPFTKGTSPTPVLVGTMVKEALDGDASSASSERFTSTAGAVNPSDIDVAGVKLGMTIPQALEALKKFDAWPVISERYSSYAHDYNFRRTDSRLFGDTGFSQKCPKATNPIRYRVAIIAAKGPRLYLRRVNEYSATPSECVWGGKPSSTVPGADPEEVLVFLSPTPGTEHVIAVVRLRSFQNHPTVDSVVESAMSKYPSGYFTSIVKQDSIFARFWRFDPSGRTMSMQEAKEAQAFIDADENYEIGDAGSAAMFLPSTTRGEVRHLDLLVRREKNRDIAQSFLVRLYDEKGLWDFEAEAQLVYKSQRDKLDKADVDKATKTGGSVKF